MAAEASLHERSADAVKDRLQVLSQPDQMEAATGRRHDMLMEDMRRPDMKTDRREKLRV
jgi:hypothetical protein